MVNTRSKQQQKDEAKRKTEETLNLICNSIRKRGKTLSSTLWNDIVTDILSRLPVEDLLRFQFACKSWYTLLREPFFIDLHLKKSVSNNNFDFMVCKYDDTIDMYSVNCDILSSSSFKLNRSIKFDFPFKIYNIYGSCNGIFLFCTDNKYYKIHMSNPSTGEYKDLSNELPKFSRRSRIGYWLGYDLSGDDYKVIIACYGKGTTHDVVYVYSMQTSSFKRLQDVPYFIYGSVYGRISSGGGILLNGAIHWLGDHDSETNGFLMRIVSFDLANDEFKDLQLPDDVILDTQSSKQLGVFEECLCIYRVKKNSSIDVFMMKGYGVKESWTKLFSIIYDLQVQNIEARICITPNGKFLVQWNRTDLVLYDPKHGGQKCGNIEIEGLCVSKESDEYLSIGTYVKSLVSLGANTSAI